MVRYSTYKKYYRNAVIAHDAPIEAALRAQMMAAVNDYRKTGTVGELPTQGIQKAISEIYRDAGAKWAVFIDKSLPKIKQTKASAEELYVRFIQDFLNQYLLSKSIIPITDTTRKMVLQVINDGVEQGLGEDEIVRNLLSNDLIISRARLVTRTETGRAMNTGAMLAAAKSSVVTNKQWVSAQDNRTRRIPRDNYDHLHMDGKEVEFDKPFVVPSLKTIDLMQYPGDPAASAGNLCNCFLPNELTKVNPLHIKKVFRSRYNGKVVTIKAANGNSFTCTPNHPILTENGFIPAGEITAGTNLVKSGFINDNVCAEFNINNSPSSFEQIYNSFSSVFNGVRKRGTIMDFYGDGSNSDIDIISTNGFLHDGIKFIKVFKNFIFKNTNFAMAFLFKKSRFRNSINNHFFSTIPHSFICAKNYFLSILQTCLSHSQIHRFASIPLSNSIMVKPVYYNASSAVEMDGKLFDTIPAVIKFDKLKNVNAYSRALDVTFSHYDGFVYTLETINQIYDINSFVAKNCRCCIVFVPQMDTTGNYIQVDENNPVQRNNIYRTIIRNNQ